MKEISCLLAMDWSYQSHYENCRVGQRRLHIGAHCLLGLAPCCGSAIYPQKAQSAIKIQSA